MGLLQVTTATQLQLVNISNDSVKGHKKQNKGLYRM
jgi:hypothetical protein